MASKIFLFEQIFFGSTSRRVSSGMSFSPFVREFRALANSNLAALPQILNESPAKCVLTVLARSAGFFARQNNPVFGFMTSFLEGARLRRDNRQPETIGNQCRGVLWCLRAASRRIVPPATLWMFVLFELIFQFGWIRRPAK